jgi:ABC-type transport system substrate-binding protein
MIKILSTAAVMGKMFGFDDLETLLGDVDDLDEAVDRLVQEGLVEEDRRSRSDVLTFSSGVVREVLYAKLSRRKRRSLHRSYAELLEKSHHGRLERVYPQLLYHFAEGDEPEKTVEYGLLHARKSLDAFSPEEAVRAAGTALEFLDDEWEGDRTLEGEARMILARSHQMRGEITDGVREAEAAIRVFEKEGAADRIVGSILQASKMLWQARRAEETMALVERGIALARKSPETETDNLVEFLSLAATLANLRAEYVKANAYLQEAEQLKAGAHPEAKREEIPAGGRLLVPFINSVTGIDPSLIGYDDQVEIAANIFETLLATDGEGRLAPLLSEDWEAVDGGRSFVFTLRQGVAFHDGTPLTADEVKRSFEETIRVRGDEMRAAMSVLQGTREFLAGEADAVSGIKAVSSHRVEFHLTEPLPIYPSLLTETSPGIARRGEGDGEERTQGTGPYRIASKEADRIVLERNPAYWGTPPRLEAVEFLPGRSASDIVDGLRSGRFDLTRPLPGADLEELMRDPRFRHRMVELPGKHTFFIVMNALSGGPARNETVRRALCGVIPVRDVIWQSKGRFAEPATGLIPPGLVGHDPGRRRRTLSREEARERIQSFSTEPLKLTAAISPGNMERHGTVIQALFQLWSEIGVEIEAVTPTLESYNEKSAQPEGTDLVLLGWISDYDDPDALTHVLFNSKTGRYRKMFSSDRCDEILAQARSESRPEVRVSLYRQFESLLEEEGIVLPLFHETNYRIPGPQVRGLRLKSSPPYVNYAEVGKSVTAEAPSPGAFAARGGGTVRIPNLGPLLKALDPRNTTHVDEAEIVSCLFETLTRVDEGARVVPFLASRIEVEDGGKRYRFKLRDGIRFHDGRRLSSRDVRFTFERVLARESCEFRWLLASIRGATDIIGGKARELSGFEIHSATEFSVHLESPFPFFTAVLSHLGLAIVPEGVNFKATTFKEGCVGTGPFRLARFEPGKRIEMERNPGYWRDGYPRCEMIQFESVGSPGDIYSGFKKGYFSIVHHLSPDRFDELRRSSEYAGGYREVPNLSVAMLGLNVKKGPLTDPALRQRLAAAVDREAIIRTLTGAAPAIASGLIPPGLLGYDASSRSSSQFRAPAAADRDKEVTLTMAFSRSSIFAPAAEQIAKNLAEAGFRLELAPTASREETLKVTTEASTDIFLNAWVADYPGTHAIVHGILDSREGQVGRFSGSPEMDRRIETARAEIDPTTRHTLYREIEEIVAQDALVIPLFYIQIYRFARPEVEGLSLSFSPPDVHYEELRVRT